MQNETFAFFEESKMDKTKVELEVLNSFSMFPLGKFSKVHISMDFFEIFCEFELIALQKLIRCKNSSCVPECTPNKQCFESFQSALP